MSGVEGDQTLLQGGQLPFNAAACRAARLQLCSVVWGCRLCLRMGSVAAGCIMLTAHMQLPLACATAVCHRRLLECSDTQGSYMLHPGQPRHHTSIGPPRGSHVCDAVPFLYQPLAQQLTASCFCTVVETQSWGSSGSDAAVAGSLRKSPTAVWHPCVTADPRPWPNEALHPHSYHAAGGAVSRLCCLGASHCYCHAPDA